MPIEAPPLEPIDGDLMAMIQDIGLIFMLYNINNYASSSPGFSLSSFTDPNGTNVNDTFENYYSWSEHGDIDENTDFVYLYGAANFVQSDWIAYGPDCPDEEPCIDTTWQDSFQYAKEALMDAIRELTGKTHAFLLGQATEVGGTIVSTVVPEPTDPVGEGIEAGEGGTAASSVVTETITCGEFPPSEPELECPPPCAGNPDAITPNWTTLTENEPFLDAQTCDYSITLLTEYEAVVPAVLQTSPNYLFIGVTKLLEYYGKKTTPYVNSAGMSIDPVQLCVSAGSIKDTFVATRKYVKMKILVVVPSTTFDTIEDIGPPEEEPSRLDQAAFVVIDNAESTTYECNFLLMCKQVARAMDIMAVRQAKWFFDGGGTLTEPTFSLKDEAQKIRNFKKKLLDLLNENGFVVLKPAPFGRKWADQIEIGFNADMEIEYVKARERGCKKSTSMTKGLNAFKNQGPQRNQRTMYFVWQLPEIWNDVTAVKPIDFGRFLGKYVAFPPIEIETESSMSESIFCAAQQDGANAGSFGQNLGDELEGLGNAIMDEILSFPDALADKFADRLCLAFEGKKRTDIDISDFKELSIRAADTAIREFFAGDLNLEKIPDLLKDISHASPKELWQKILDNLGVCGLLSLLEMAFACLMAGMSVHDAKKLMITAAFEAMDDANFEKIFIGLPPDVQAEVLGNIGDEFKQVPPPWDVDYREGSYSGQGTTHSIDYVNSPANVDTDDFSYTTDPETGEQIPTLIVTADEGGYWQSQVETTTSGIPTFEGSTTGIGINETAIGMSYGDAGSIGTAADNIMDLLISAYKDAFLNMIDQNLIDLDMLMEELGKLPGAEFVARIIQQMDCPPLPLFTPPLDDFLKTLELDFCRGHFAISMPILSVDISIPDIFKILLSVAVELIKQIVVKLIMLILKKILEIIFEALCALLGMLGEPLVEAITGGNAFREAMGDALCPDATNEDIDSALLDIWNATGFPSCASPDDMPTKEDAAAFSEVVAAVLTNSEVIDLMDGKATAQVTQMVSDVTKSQVPSLACMNSSDIEKLFQALGKMINPEILVRAQQMTGLDEPVCDSICASPAQLQQFNEVRCAMMQSKGLPPEECEVQLASLAQRAKEDFADLAKILQGGPFQEFPPLLGDDPVCPDSGEPFKPGDSILPEIPAVLDEIAGRAAKAAFEDIGREHVDDLVESRGFFDMVLSDSNGAGLNQHARKVSLFGKPLSEDLGFLEWYTDNRIDTKQMVVSQGLVNNSSAWAGVMPNINVDQNRGLQGDWGILGFNDMGVGGYPFGVASLLQKYFVQYNQKVDTGLQADPSYAFGTSMRGEDIPFDPDVNAGSNTPCRGLPWEVYNDDYKRIKLYYKDYSGDSSDKYRMMIRAKVAMKEDALWNVVDKTETAIFERPGNQSDYERAQRFVVTHPMSPGVQQLVNSLIGSGVDMTHPLDEELFSRYIGNVIESYPDFPTNDPDFAIGMEAVRGRLRASLPYLQDVYMRKFALLLASNSNNTIKPLPDPFQFGYDTNQEVERVYMGGPPGVLDAEFLDNNPDWTGVSEEEQQPIFDRFGGSYSDPPFFEKNPERFGWLGIMDKFVPEWDACDPIDGSEPREPICKFEDLKDMYTDLMKKYHDDKRLFIRPDATCADPVPFNAIFSRGAAAGVDTTLLAIIRIYVTEELLKGASIFSVYGSECFGKILSRYIATFVEEDVSQTGVEHLPSKKYFYLFMEQVVQMFGRQVDLGLITVAQGSDEETALKNLNKLQTSFVQPTGLFQQAVYNKKRDEMVQAALDYEENDNWPPDYYGQAGIRTLLSHFVLEEIGNMIEQFEESLHPNGMPVPNFPSIFFGSSAFIQGSLETGPADVWNGKGSTYAGTSNVTEADLEPAYAYSNVTYATEYPRLAGGTTETDIGIGNHPFRLERYIRLTEKTAFMEAGASAPDELTSTTSGGSRLPYLFGVVPLQDFQNWVENLPNTLSNTVASELFDGISLGYRLVFTTSPSARGNKEWGDGPAHHMCNPTNFSYLGNAVNNMTTTNLLEKTLRVPVSQFAYDSTSLYVPNYPPDSFADPALTHQAVMFMVPLAAAELDIDISQPLGDLAENLNDFDSSNRACLLGELAETDGYKMMFNICVPFEKMLSWLAIYTINNFLPSIGWVEDGWVKNYGRWMGELAGFRSWNQKSFEKSKRAAKRTFMRFYHSSDPTYEDEEQKVANKKITKAKKPKPNGAFPGTFRWWKLRRKIRKPTDKNGILCPEDY